MKVLLVVGWAFLLFVFTCTSNLDALFYHQDVHFHWMAHPQLSDLLITRDAHFSNPYYLFIKLGHLSGFALFFYWLYLWIDKRGVAFTIAISYAVLTEVLQLYFSRDGRFIDMGIDSIGVIASFFLFPKLKKSLFKHTV